MCGLRSKSLRSRAVHFALMTMIAAVISWSRDKAERRDELGAGRGGVFDVEGEGLRGRFTPDLCTGSAGIVFLGRFPVVPGTDHRTDRVCHPWIPSGDLHDSNVDCLGRSTPLKGDGAQERTSHCCPLGIDFLQLFSTRRPTCILVCTLATTANRNLRDGK